MEVAYRPVTQHGMTGMKGTAQKVQRKVADSSYYENQMRLRIHEIINEIKSMNDKMSSLIRFQKNKKINK